METEANIGDENNSNSSAATLHFEGIQILTAAITKLGSLGLSKATSVVLHGISHGGTAAILVIDNQLWSETMIAIELALELDLVVLAVVCVNLWRFCAVLSTLTYTVLVTRDL